MTSAAPRVLRRAEAVRRYGERVVRRELAAGRWSSIAGVVITHNGPLTWHERLQVGIAAVAPGRAAVDAASVLHLTHRLDQPEQPEVVLLGGTHRPPVAGVSYRYIGDFSGKLVTANRLPALAPSHAALRAAARCPDERTARELLCRALQRRATHADQLRTALGPRPRLRFSALAAEVAVDFEGGIQSVPEKDFDNVVRAFQLPQPTRQRVVRGRDGRYYLDAGYDEFGLGVEVHGWQHWEFAQREADNWRSAQIVAGGRRLLVFSSWAVRREQQRVGELLRLALQAGGWR